MGCVFSCILTYAWCRAGCSSSKVASQLVFAPPQPTYKLEGDGTKGATPLVMVLHDEVRGMLLEYSLWARPRSASALPPGLEIGWAKTRDGTRDVATFYLPLQPQDRSGGGKKDDVLTLLFSHGNAVDCGLQLDYLSYLGAELGMHVLTYDYNGYGASSSAEVAEEGEEDMLGPPDVTGTLQDIDAVWSWGVARHGLRPSRTVVYGQSVGSGPSCHIAAQQARRGCCAGGGAGAGNAQVSDVEMGTADRQHRGVPFRGLVLHSPLASGLMTLSPDSKLKRIGCCWPSCCCACLDIYKNTQKARAARCPVLLLHGLQDEVISSNATLEIQKRLRRRLRRTPWMPPTADHNNVVEHDMPAFFARMREFLRSLGDGEEEEEEKGVEGGGGTPGLVAWRAQVMARLEGMKAAAVAAADAADAAAVDAKVGERS